MNKTALIKRLITAIIAAPLVLALVFFAKPFIFSMLSSIIIFMAACEWMHFIESEKKIFFITFWLGILLFLIILNYEVLYPDTLLFSSILNFICYYLISVAIFWIFVPVILWKFTHGKFQRFSNMTIIIGGWYVLFATWLAFLKLFTIMPHGLLFIYLLFLVWIADTAAYFCGQRWGRIKLIPEVSPGKTLEGLLGACFCILVFSSSIAILFIPDFSLKIEWILISLVTGLISVVGDLAISLLKRQRKLKDTGKLLPGHGGILDRIDSLLSAAPFFLVLVSIRIW